MEQERRTHRRVSLLAEVVWEGAAGKYEARTSDLSATGCFIDTMGQVTVGEILNFQVRLPAGEWIRAQGEVVYEQPGTGFAVRFTNLSEFDRQRIEWLIRAEMHRAEKQTPGSA